MKHRITARISTVLLHRMRRTWRLYDNVEFGIRGLYLINEEPNAAKFAKQYLNLFGKPLSFEFLRPYNKFQVAHLFKLKC